MNKHESSDRGPRGAARQETRCKSTALRDQTPASHQRFHNPYNFIPALPRKTSGSLADEPPVGHHRLHRNRWTGAIEVELTVKTPLLIPDASRVKTREDGHKIFALRRGPDGRPWLPATSVKGMLRSAYEAVTNSRFGVFPQAHMLPLGYRMRADAALDLVPARVRNADTVELLSGTEKPGTAGTRPGVMYAAWLPQYRGSNFRPALPRAVHGEEVYAWLQKATRTARSGRGRFQQFDFWEVLCYGKSKPPRPSPKTGTFTQSRGDTTVTYTYRTEILCVRGYVVITGDNIRGKHDERLFFSYQGRTYARLTTEAKQRWDALMKSYLDQHDDDELHRPPPPSLASEWSRHLTDSERRRLGPGALCYVRLRRAGTELEAYEAFPVIIGRTLFENSPWDLLDPSVRPATSLSELSPADRVFGWVNQQGEGSYRGHLRISPVRCETEDAIQQVTGLDGDGLPLAILSAPKLQQGRFNEGRYSGGTVSQQPDGQDKERTGYDSPLNPKVLRGRKVYPHHAGLPDGYWDPENARKRALVGERYLEYPRPLQNDQELRDRQNRSITEWVRPGARFCFTIYVSNLSDVELGALLWLLSLPADHFHRLGSGKPLGFGSVRLAIRRAHLRRGSLWESHYASLGQPTDPDALSIIRGPDDDQLRLVIERFKEAVDAAYGSPPARREEDLNSRFERVAFIEAFLRALRGHDDRLPIHYPRVDPRPDPAGENYRWFAQNERGGRLSLPDLASDRGLPYRP